MAVSLRDYCSRFRIADGDWRAGSQFDAPPDSALWEQAFVAQPGAIRSRADAFLDAGSEIITTQTHRLNAIALAAANPTAAPSPATIESLNRKWAEQCRAAVSDHPAKDRLVLGAMGPTEQLLILDEVQESALLEAYSRQAAALAHGGVDAILCAGFTELPALEIAVRATATTGLASIACMTFDSGADPPETALGVTIPHACEALKAAGAAAVGANPGATPDRAADIVAAIRKSFDGPTWICLTAGPAQLIDGRTAFPEKPADFASRLAAIRRAGAAILAGDRGVTPDHIAALVAARGDSPQL